MCIYVYEKKLLYLYERFQIISFSKIVTRSKLFQNIEKCNIIKELILIDEKSYLSAIFLQRRYRLEEGTLFLLQSKSIDRTHELLRS